MREIRFRVFYRGKMYPVLELHGYVHPMIAVEMELDGLGLRHVSLDSEHVEGLMQFTGLKDKNGKEIYEFDIVKAWIDFGPGGEHLETFPVTSSPFGVNIQEWNYKENRLPEVIGNIYEHSHLLK